MHGQYPQPANPYYQQGGMTPRGPPVGSGHHPHMVQALQQPAGSPRGPTLGPHHYPGRESVLRRPLVFHRGRQPFPMAFHPHEPPRSPWQDPTSSGFGHTAHNSVSAGGFQTNVGVRTSLSYHSPHNPPHARYHPCHHQCHHCPNQASGDAAPRSLYHWTPRYAAIPQTALQDRSSEDISVSQTSSGRLY